MLCLWKDLEVEEKYQRWDRTKMPKSNEQNATGNAANPASIPDVGTLIPLGNGQTITQVELTYALNWLLVAAYRKAKFDPECMTKMAIQEKYKISSHYASNIFNEHGLGSWQMSPIPVALKIILNAGTSRNPRGFNPGG